VTQDQYTNGLGFGDRFARAYGLKAASTCLRIFTHDAIVSPTFLAGMGDAVIAAAQDTANAWRYAR